MSGFGRDTRYSGQDPRTFGCECVTLGGIPCQPGKPGACSLVSDPIPTPARDHDGHDTEDTR